MTNRQHIAALDGLRGVAAVAVFAAHADSEGFLSLPHTNGLGKIGVALFYTLSGFLMAHLYLDRPWTAVNVRHYLAARAARIFPLFYLAVFAGSVLLFAGGIVVYGFRTPVQILLNLGFVRGNGVLWSVAAEVQFYLIFILLWGAAARRYLFAALAVVCAAQVGALAATGASWGEGNALTYWMHYFLGGIVICRIHTANLHRFAGFAAHRFAGPASFLGFACCVMLMPGPRQAAGFSLPVEIFLDPLVFVGVALFTGLALAGQGPFKALETPPMRWLGARSFGIYLFHVPVLLIMPNIVPGDLAGFAGVTAVTLGIADVLHRCIERPAGRLLREWLGASRAAGAP